MSFYSDFHGLDEVEVNGKTYVDKKQLLALIRDEKHRYEDATEPGYMVKKKGHRIASIYSLNHLAVLINKRFYDELNKDVSRFVIAGDGWQNIEGGVLVYFKGWCRHLSDGEQTPVFSNDPHEAVRFESREEAQQVEHAIRAQYPNTNTAVVYAVWPRAKWGIKKLHEIFGWPADRDWEDVLQDELMLGRDW